MIAGSHDENRRIRSAMIDGWTGGANQRPVVLMRDNGGPHRWKVPGQAHRRILGRRDHARGAGQEGRGARTQC